MYVRGVAPALCGYHTLVTGADHLIEALTAQSLIGFSHIHTS